MAAPGPSPIEDGALISIPRNMFASSLLERGKSDVFHGSLLERKTDLEQFFWTQDCVDRLVKALEHMPGRACLTAPSLAHAWHALGEEEVCLDIDKRFEYLPRFHYYDVRAPYALTGDDADFRVLILDPPYFVVPIEQFRRAVDVLTGANYKTKLLVGFLHREEKRLLAAFAPYGLRPTAFSLEYASIKPSKWANFCLYANVDLPGVKRK